MFEILLSGLLQGLLEWFPVSSQGMISLFLISQGYTLLEATDITYFLHVGTMFAVIIYFWNDLKHVLKPDSGFDLRVLLYLVWSTFTSILVGLPCYLLINYLGFLSSSAPKIVGVLLIIMGLIQGARKELGVREASTLTWRDGALTGILQGFSALPGVSRSGVTILAMLISGFNIETSLKYSFIAGIPVIMGLQVLEFVKGLYFKPLYLAGALVSFVVGLATISYALKLVKKVNFSVFCIIIGLLSIFL